MSEQDGSEQDGSEQDGSEQDGSEQDGRCALIQNLIVERTIAETYGELKRTCLDFRSLCSLWDDQYFQRDLKGMPVELREEMIVMILQGKRKEVTRKLKQYRETQWGEIPHRRIKEIARERGIKNYSRLSKVELLREIHRDEKRRIDEQGNSGTGCSGSNSSLD